MFLNYHFFIENRKICYRW